MVYRGSRRSLLNGCHRARVYKQCHKHGMLVSSPSALIFLLLGLFFNGPAFKVESAPPPHILPPSPCSRAWEPAGGRQPAPGNVMNSLPLPVSTGLPPGHSRSRMLCIFLISIKVQRVLLGPGSQEITPSQVHSWLLFGVLWGFLREGAAFFEFISLTQA